MFACLVARVRRSAPAFSAGWIAWIAWRVGAISGGDAYRWPDFGTGVNGRLL